MTSVKSRLRQLEVQSPAAQPNSTAVEGLFAHLQTIYGRKKGELFTEQALERGSAIKTVAIGFCAPQPLPDFVLRRLVAFSKRDDALGAVSRIAVEMSE